MRNFSWVVCLSMSLAACGGGSDGGGEGDPCGPDKPCQAGLICDPIQLICVDKNNFHPDAGTIDAGDQGSAPDTNIVSGPNGFTNGPVVFEFTATKSPSTFQCKIDDGEFEPCTSPITYDDLGDGAHVFRVKAIDAFDQEDLTPAIRDFTLDTAAPDTTITDGPTGDVAASEAVFSFECSTPTCTFQCQIDSGAFAPCGSGDTFNVTVTGSHTFRVKAIDQALNEDPTPAERSWNVTQISLQTIILTSPPPATQSSDATFTFECRFAGVVTSCTFQCALDAAVPSDCTSPISFTSLAEAVHTFSVVATRVVDPITDPTPDTRTWKVDRTSPVVTITSPTADEITGPGVTFVYTADEPATFECNVGDGFQVCPDGGFAQTFNSGSRTLTVRATDRAGNVSAPKMVTFTVDADGPVITVVTPNGTSGATVTLDFSFTDLSPPVTFTCDLGAGPFDCAPGTVLPTLSAGANTLVLVGTDKWGNRTTRTVMWTVDATGPVVTIIGPLPGVLVPGNVTIAWTFPNGDAVRSVCTIDGGAVACSGTSLTITLPSGDHTFEIVAFDANDNPSVEPPSFSHTSFTVDADLPVVVPGTPSSACAPITVPFNSDDPSEEITFTCSLNNAAFTACNRPGITFARAQLLNGTNTLRISATDAVGNVSEQLGVVTFTADLVGPVLTIPATTAPINTGSATFTVTASEALVGLSAETHVANPGGGDLTRACTCTATACTCDFLAAHTNVVHARAVDACANASGPTGGAATDSVGTLTAPFGSNEGHVVLIGHDYFNNSDEPTSILFDAARLAPFAHRDYGAVFPRDGRPIRVLIFRDANTVPGSESETELANLQNALGDAFTIAVFDDPSTVQAVLPGYDVLLIADQNTRGGLAAIATTWTPILTPFLNNGGVVVVTAGEHVDGGPNTTHELVGGLLSVANVVSGNGLINSNPDATVAAALRYFFVSGGADPSPPFWVSQNIPVTYDFPSSSVGYTLNDSGQPSTVVEMLVVFDDGGGTGSAGAIPGGPPPPVDQRFALVVDKVFPVYNVGFTLTGPSGTDFNGNILPVIDAAGSFNYTLNDVGQSRVDCRAFTRDFFSNSGPTNCGSDTPPAGPFAYDMGNPFCPTCGDDTYRFDLVVVTPSTDIDGGEGARVGTSNPVFVDGGAFADVIGPINSTFFIFGAFEPLQMQEFTCTLFQNVNGTLVVVDSRVCGCPQSPPTTCVPGPLPGPGSPFGSYNFSGLPLVGNYVFRVNMTDGLGHTFALDSPFTVTSPDGTASVTAAAGQFLSGNVCGTVQARFPFTVGAEAFPYTSVTCTVTNASTGGQVIAPTSCGNIAAVASPTLYNYDVSVPGGPIYNMAVTVVDAFGNQDTDTGSIDLACISVTKPGE